MFYDIRMTCQKTRVDSARALHDINILWIERAKVFRIISSGMFSDEKAVTVPGKRKSASQA